MSTMVDVYRHHWGWSPTHVDDAEVAGRLHTDWLRYTHWRDNADSIFKGKPEMFKAYEAGDAAEHCRRAGGAVGQTQRVRRREVMDRPPAYRLELQRGGRLEKSVSRTNPCSAQRQFRRLLQLARNDGMVVIVQGGREIAPHDLRDLAVEERPE